MRIYGPYLFDSALSTTPEYSPGRAVSIECLANVFTTPCRTGRTRIESANETR
jgi:hypothetical protein